MKRRRPRRARAVPILPGLPVLGIEFSEFDAELTTLEVELPVIDLGEVFEWVCSLTTSAPKES